MLISLKHATKLRTELNNLNFSAQLNILLLHYNHREDTTFFYIALQYTSQISFIRIKISLVNFMEINL